MIIDASVAFKWIVEEPGSEHAINWIGRAELVAPTLIHAEVGNALWKRVRKGELVDDGEIEDRLADLLTYVRTIDETPVLARALRLALDVHHPVYDCVYLALAEQLDDQLLTADLRFIRAIASSPYASRVKELGHD
jgi:predicted nucleic acid-binding protein